ncbi:hypothetical protein [Terrabacter terrigena]|uniref:Uncharacterized protein n=1 Tax=Terrabacter terrigena TaxID=574718 RepID=A0ABW3MXS4_9MICO
MTEGISPELAKVVEAAVAKALGEAAPAGDPMEVGSPEWAEAPIAPGSAITNGDAQTLDRLANMSAAAQPVYMPGREHALRTIEGAAGGNFDQVVAGLESSPTFRKYVERAETAYVRKD